jgi:hypothetical protein
MLAFLKDRGHTARLFQEGAIMEIKITRMYSGADGESHFEDIKVSLKVVNDVLRFSDTEKATGVIFSEVRIEKQPNWHNAPRRQYVIALQGEHEVEVGDGTRRRFKPGDVLLAEDTTGRGHTIHLINHQPYTAAYVTLD